MTTDTGGRHYGFDVDVIRSTRRHKTVQARIDGDRLEVRVPASMPAREIDQWVDRMAERLARKRSSHHVDLGERAADLARRYRLEMPGSVVWSPRQGKRWGSCTPSSRTIRISDRMAALPGWVLDYVIVHELAHLSEPGHGPGFHALVDRYERSERARGYLQAVSDLAGTGPLPGAD
jgi:predicted metal-dependent hydrolase